MLVKLELEEDAWNDLLHFMDVRIQDLNDYRRDYAKKLVQQLEKQRQIPIILTKQEWEEFFKWAGFLPINNPTLPYHFKKIREQYDNQTKD